MNVSWSVVEVGNMGSDQLLHGSEGSDGLDGLDVTTSELPVHAASRTSVLADDQPRGDDPTDTAISIRLETDELPFQQPNLRTVPVAPAARNWRATIADVGKWPLMALGAAAVLLVVFATFISRNGQSLSGDREAAEPPPVVESASAAATADEIAGAPAQAEFGSDPLTAGDESDDSPARSTGTLGPGGGSGFFTGQIVEPDRSLTGTDVDWAPTTIKPATTVTTPPTVVSSTTPPESTSTFPSTSTTATTGEPSGSWVRAIGPGAADERDAAVVSGRVKLEAEGSDGTIRYRFFVFVRTDDDGWRQVERSRWRSRPSWTLDVDRYDGRTIRWTVIGATGFRNLTDESSPLYLRVGDGDGDGARDESVADVNASLTNGDFEQGVGGFDTFRNYGNGAIAGWISSSGEFEVWASGFEGVKAASGSYFIELNAGSPTTITQRVDVVPGMDLRWSFKHRSRTGAAETVEVVVGSIDATRFTATGDKWRGRKGTYRVPEGVDSIDFSIRAVNGGSVGNFIDDITLRSE